jgi:hypothetical protein
MVSLKTLHHPLGNGVRTEYPPPVENNASE